MPATAPDLLLYFAFMIAAMSLLSLPLAPATLLAAKIAPPWAVAGLAALAAAISATFDYHFIRRAFRMRVLETARKRPMFRRAERLAKVAPFWTTAGFAALPLPFTIVRILMPLSGYPAARYVGAVALGRWPRIYVIASFGLFVDVPNEVLIALLIGGVALAVVAATLRKLGVLGRSTEPAEAEPPPPSP